MSAANTLSLPARQGTILRLRAPLGLTWGPFPSPSLPSLSPHSEEHSAPPVHDAGPGASQFCWELFHTPHSEPLYLLQSKIPFGCDLEHNSGTQVITSTKQSKQHPVQGHNTPP